MSAAVSPIYSQAFMAWKTKSLCLSVRKSLLQIKLKFYFVQFLNKARSRNHYFCGNAISVTYSKRMLGLSSVAVRYFSTYRNPHFFGKMLLNTKCMFWFSPQILSEIFLILTRIQRDMIINIHVMCSYSCYFCMKLEFSRHDFWKYLNIKCTDNSYSRSQVVACGRTDMTKLIVAFRSFATCLLWGQASTGRNMTYRTLHTNKVNLVKPCSIFYLSPEVCAR